MRISIRLTGLSALVQIMWMSSRCRPLSSGRRRAPVIFQISARQSLTFFSHSVNTATTSYIWTDVIAIQAHEWTTRTWTHLQRQSSDNPASPHIKCKPEETNLSAANTPEEKKKMDLFIKESPKKANTSFMKAWTRFTSVASVCELSKMWGRQQVRRPLLTASRSSPSFPAGLHHTWRAPTVSSQGAEEQKNEQLIRPKKSQNLNVYLFELVMTQKKKRETKYFYLHFTNMGHVPKFELFMLFVQQCWQQCCIVMK